MSLATASVDIVADTSKFKDDLRRKLENDCAGDALSKCLSKGISKGDADKIGRAIGKGINDGISRSCDADRAIAKCMEKASGRVGRRAGEKVGRDFSDGLESALGRGAGGASRGLNNTIGQIGRQSTLASAGVRLLTTSLIGLSAAAAPAALAPLAIGAAGLASGFGIAAAGIAAWGAVAIPTISSVMEKEQQLDDLQKKIAEADTAKERAAAMKEYKEVLDSLSPAQAKAVQGLDKLESAFDKLQKKYETPILDTFGKGLETLGTGLQRLEPFIGPVNTALGNLATQANEALGSPFWKNMSEYFGRRAGQAVEGFGQGLGFAAKGAASLFKTFDEGFGTVFNKSPETAFKDAMKGFAEWSDELGKSKGWQTFLDYAKEAWPVVKDLAGNIATVATNLAESFGPAFMGALKGIGAIMDFAADHPTLTAWVAGLIAGAVALKRLLDVASAAKGWIGKIGNLFGKGKGMCDGEGEITPKLNCKGIDLEDCVTDNDASLKVKLDCKNIDLEDCVSDNDARLKVKADCPDDCNVKINYKIDVDTKGFGKGGKGGLSGLINAGKDGLLGELVSKLPCPDPYECRSRIVYDVDVDTGSLLKQADRMKVLYDALGMLADLGLATLAQSLPCPESYQCNAVISYNVDVQTSGLDSVGSVAQIVAANLALKALDFISGDCPQGINCSVPFTFTVTGSGYNETVSAGEAAQVLIAHAALKLLDAIAGDCPQGINCSVPFSFTVTGSGFNDGGFSAGQTAEVLLAHAAFKGLDAIAGDCPQGINCQVPFTFNVSGSGSNVGVFDVAGKVAEIEAAKLALEQLGSDCPPGIDCNVPINFSVGGDFGGGDFGGGGADTSGICPQSCSITVSWVVPNPCPAINCAGSVVWSVPNPCPAINCAGSVVWSVPNPCPAINCGGSVQWSNVPDPCANLNDCTVGVNWNPARLECPDPCTVDVRWNPERLDCPDPCSVDVNWNTAAFSCPGDCTVQVNYSGTPPKCTADGAIVTRAETRVIGEAGPEVVIPLTRPARARYLAEQSGLLAMLGSSRRVAATGATAESGTGTGGVVINAPITVQSQASDPEIVAVKTVSRLTAAVASTSQLGLGVVA